MIRNAIQRFMYGRYGGDQLNVFLLVLYLIYAFWVTLRYAMAWYLFLDDPYGSARGHLRASARLMMGWKWEYLKLELSFFGWLLLWYWKKKGWIYY